MTNEELKKIFLEVLQKHAADATKEPKKQEGFWAEKLDPAKKKETELNKLSGLFLPSVSANYENSKTKIMLVGAETAGWYPLLKRDKEGQALTATEVIAKPTHQRGPNDLPAESLWYQYQSLEDYIEKTMHRHAQVFGNGMKKPKNDKGRTFYNYLRGLDKELSQIGSGYDSGGWVWSNLHCFDWNGKSPIFKKEPYESFIKPVSKALLQKQIEILKPDFIVFLSGISAAKTRNEFLKCVALPKQNHCQKTAYLWEFRVDVTDEVERHIHCIRTHHPSARKPDAQRALTASQKLLRRLIEERASLNR
ncbi:uracil-DNA glycosylase family protein [Limnohabitans lacus]|uniref:Uracil-DNA glycosylase-like domain-containing protein n=1 Tax=Limnohabitans lacus TaxID=3045173 RepID=A0ABT6X3C6_9BURK|nr:uracil-DNA glycosylase family protein [Limnohabitans sp. HM2-2]MDI9232564.1 hypothetical protein [Limnohabitans sp. HM2-2]